MEAFSASCAWHAPPDLAYNAMPYAFLIQAPLPNLFSFYAATYCLPESKTH